jgi:lipopolysaccharide biosynthesis glycosyltransferase
MNNANNIPVFFTFNQNYVLPAAVAIFSLLKYADKQYFYKLYILHDELSKKQQFRLLKIVKQFENNASLEFINVEGFHQNSDWDQIKNKQHYSKDIINKLIVDIVFPQYDKIICSDVDVVFQGDISKSYFYHKNESFFVEGVRDIFQHDINLYPTHLTSYEKEIFTTINVGHIVFNLDIMRKNKIGEKMRIYWKDNLNRLIFPEQDVINLCCYPNIGYLPFSHMVYPYYYSTKKNKIVYRKDIENAENVFREALSNPILIHYVGYNKPWNKLFMTKWFVWMKELFQTDFVIDYFVRQPYYLLDRIKRYNLVRFFQKCKKRFTK